MVIFCRTIFLSCRPAVNLPPRQVKIQVRFHKYTNKFNVGPHHTIIFQMIVAFFVFRVFFDVLKRKDRGNDPSLGGGAGPHFCTSAMYIVCTLFVLAFHQTVWIVQARVNGDGKRREWGGRGSWIVGFYGVHKLYKEQRDRVGVLLSFPSFIVHTNTPFPLY